MKKIIIILIGFLLIFFSGCLNIKEKVLVNNTNNSFENNSNINNTFVKKNETKIISKIDKKICEKNGGNWNSCPSTCPPNAQICTTVCGPPNCEFNN